MVANSIVYQPIYRNEEAISAIKAFSAAQNHGAGVFDGGVSPRHGTGALESPRYFGGFSQGHNFEAQNNDYLNSTTAASAAFVVAGVVCAAYIAKGVKAKFQEWRKGGTEEEDWSN